MRKQKSFHIIETPDGTFYTRSSSCSFSLLLSNSGNINISVSWGNETGEAEYFSNGATLGYGVLPIIEPNTETETKTETEAESGTGSEVETSNIEEQPQEAH